MSKHGRFCTRTASGFLALVLGMGFQLPASAELEEIVVMARKTAESLEEKPVAVSVLTNEFFYDYGLNN